MDAMERLMRGHTTLMIAHRLGTLSRFDLRLSLERTDDHQPASGEAIVR